MATHSSILAWEISWTKEPGTVHGVTKSWTRLSMHAFHSTDICVCFCFFVFLTVLYCFHYCSFVVQLEMRECNTSSFFSSFSRQFWPFCHLLCLHTNFRIICSSSVKKKKIIIASLIGMALPLYNAQHSLYFQYNHF